MKYALLTLIGFAALAGSIDFYVHSQGGHFSCDRQEIGLVMTKGYYRAWRLEFCDFLMWDGSRWEPLCIEQKPNSSYGPMIAHRGYRFPPRFYHTDLSPSWISNVVVGSLSVTNSRAGR